jgi:hypothetical protein
MDLAGSKADKALSISGGIRPLDAYREEKDQKHVPRVKDMPKPEHFL